MVKMINNILRSAIFILLTATCTYAQQVDSAFAVDGMIPYGANGNSQSNLGIGNKCAIQADGKIVVAIDKYDPNGPTDLFFYTYRYNADGSTDTTYGDGGASKIFAGSSSKNRDLKIQADGKIIVVGESEYCINGICGAPQFVMMRILANGLVDSSFGTDGVVLSDDIFGNTGTYANPVRVLLASNNKYIIAGRGPGYTQFVARLNYNGSVDNTFGNNGKYLDSTVQAHVKDITMDANENIYCLFLKYSTPLDTMNYADNYVVKLKSNGQLDNTFGSGGKRIFSIGNDEYPAAIALRNDGKIVIAGTVRTLHYAYGELDKGYVAILNTDGTTSNLLNAGSSIVKIAGDSTTFFSSVTITSNNEMLLGGNVITKINGNYHQKSLLVLMKDNGSLVNTFNGSGYMVMVHGKHSPIGALADILDTKLLPNQKIICVGYRNPIMANVKRSVYLMQIKNSGIGIANETADFSALEEDVQIYPNPSDGRISIYSASGKHDHYSVEIYNVSGLRVYTAVSNSEIDLSNFK